MIAGQNAEGWVHPRWDAPPTPTPTRRLADKRRLRSSALLGPVMCRGRRPCFLSYDETSSYRGEPGPPPGDIDVLVVGTPDPDDVHDAAVRAEQALGREVNTVVVSVDRWNKAEDPFLQQIRAGPRVPVLAADDRTAST